MRLSSVRSTRSILVACLAGAAALVAGPASAAAAEPPGFVATGIAVTPFSTADNTPGTAIPVGVGARGVAVTPDGKTALVTNGGSDNVTPIDLTTANNTPGLPIAVGDEPRGIAITPDGKTAYVVNSGTGNVTPIDIATKTPGTAIPVGATRRASRSRRTARPPTSPTAARTP